MDIRQLKYFIAVAEERNISRAAARLHISQPPLTRHIQTLEEDVGVMLFKRTNWGVELTQAGEALLKHARNIKDYVELATEQARLAGDGQVGRIDIGVYGSAMLGIIPRILNTFQESHPLVQIVLHYVQKPRQIESLHDRRLMFAFERYLPETQDLHSELVCKERLMVALNRRHPLAECESIRPGDLYNEPLVGEMDSNVYAAAQPMFLQHGFMPVVAQKAPDMIATVAMVGAGFGCALVPESMLNMLLPNVVYRPLKTTIDVSVGLHCAYRKDESSQLMQELLGCVRAFRGLNLLSSNLCFLSQESDPAIP